MSAIVINGKSYTGNVVQVVNGKVIIDGKTVNGGDEKTISISVEGNIESLSCDQGIIEIKGSAGQVKTMSGDVTCTDISGSVSTMSGDIHCHSIGGNVSTMSGNITGVPTPRVSAK